LVRKPDFVPITIPGVSAFLKAGKRRVAEASETARGMGSHSSHSQSQSGSRPAPATRPAMISSRTPLDLAAKLAERAQWVDVIRLCESYLREQGECAEAMFLLGDARRAQGEMEVARWHYERTLQLMPEHTMATLRLAQLPSAAALAAAALARRPPANPLYQP
jgi:hypothetical protein